MEKWKKYFDVCQKEEWNLNSIDLYCKNNKIDLIDFRKDVKYYINNYLTKNILELTNKQIVFIYNKEMIQIISTYKKVIEELKNNNHNLNLYSNLITIIKEYLFNLFITFNFDSTKIKEKMQELNLPFTSTCEIVAKYALNTKKWNKDKMKQCFSHLTTKNFETVYELLEKILFSKNDEEVIFLIENSLQSFSQIKLQIHNFIICSIYDSEYDKTKLILEEKLENYKKYLIEKNRIKLLEKRNNETPSKTELALREAKKNVKDFLESKYISRIEYFEKTNMKPSLFNSHVHLIKIHEPELYALYQKKVNLFMGINYSNLISEINEVVHGLKNGIEFNNHTRTFDLLDYYQTTKMARHNCLKLAKQILNTHDYKLISIFFKKYNTSKPIRNIKALLDEKTILGMKLDNNKKLIPNTGHEVSIEEKLEVLNYLKNNNIPLLDDIYIIALRRHVNDELIIDKSAVENIKNI